MAATAPPPATVAYPTPSGQPMFVQPGVPPVGPPMAMPAVAPGSVYYYPQINGGAGGILMPVQFAQQPKNYEYQPSNYLVLSVFTLLACGIFSPLSLILSVPALFFSLKSSKSGQLGAIKEARRQGVIAAYLNITAIVAALVVACVATGAVIGSYAKEYALQNCLNKLRERNGGELPSLTTNRYGYYNYQTFYC